MSDSAVVSGSCFVLHPADQFESLNMEFISFLDRQECKKFVSSCPFELQNWNGVLSLEPYGDHRFGWTEHEESEYWLMFLVNDFFKAKKIVIHGSFIYEDNEGDFSRFVISKNWKVKFQRATFQWHRAVTLREKFPEREERAV